MLKSAKPSKALKTLILGSCSLVALHAAPVLAQTTPVPGPVAPLYGNLSPFYGNLSPFYGNLSPFYGNLSPFYGNLSPFYGNLSPFWGNLSPFTANPEVAASMASPSGAGSDAFWGQQVGLEGAANPFAKNPSPYVPFAQVGGFWTTASANWSTVMSTWANAKTSTDYANLASMLQSTIIAPASNFWGAAVAAGPLTVGVTGPVAPTSGQAKKAAAAATVSTFQQSFSNTILTNAGITFNADGSINASSLAAVSPTQQAMMFMNFYDGLMNYSGTDHVDWWMGAVHWSPNLALNASLVTPNNPPVSIGMLDFSVVTGAPTPKGTIVQAGSTVVGNGHGTAVGSLIMGSIDGSNIMGVMPLGTANIAIYNPYDSTGTTNWTDVGLGVQSLASTIFNKGANAAPTGVINASLGVPGWTLNPGWNTALSSGAAYGHVLVVAAGNDGVSQTQNVPWNFATNPALLIVGSVGVNGQISNFSNTPGAACLVDVNAPTSACTQANMLSSHFIVAPGELILVSDGSGGSSRQTGTSLAAPLVSGAVALLQARWPWLSNFPNETTQIILQSATKLGTNPGNDPIYGAGELNIAASQSPLNFNALQYYQVTGSGNKQSTVAIPITSVVSQVNSGAQATWNSSSLYFSAIEQIGNTHRDFQIPLASTLVGQMVSTQAGSQLFQSYITQELKSWVASGANFADQTPATLGFAGFMQSSTPLGKVGDMELRLAMTPNTPAFGFKASNVTADTNFGLIGPNSSLRFGFGSAAGALDGRDGFTQQSDYQLERGGANPLLGLASGGAYMDWRQNLLPNVAFNVGVEQRRDERDLQMFGASNLTSASRIYSANAEHFGLDFSVNDRLTLHTSLTRLQEDAGLLGIQSLDTNQLGNGSTTTGATVGFDWSLGGGYMVSASGTSASTTTGAHQSLQTTPGGLQSSAGEVAISKAGLFTRLDRIKLTLAKSMQVDSGKLQYTSFGVVNRQTGDLGIINETSGVGGGTTPVSAELMYGRLLPKQSAEMSFFLRAETNPYDTSIGKPVDYVTGAKYRFVF